MVLGPLLRVQREGTKQELSFLSRDVHCMSQELSFSTVEAQHMLSCCSLKHKVLAIAGGEISDTVP